MVSPRYRPSLVCSKFKFSGGIQLLDMKTTSHGKPDLKTSFMRSDLPRRVPVGSNSEAWQWLGRAQWPILYTGSNHNLVVYTVTKTHPSLFLTYNLELGWFLVTVNTRGQGGTDGCDSLVVVRLSRFFGQILGDHPQIRIFGGKLVYTIFC